MQSISTVSYLLYTKYLNQLDQLDILRRVTIDISKTAETFYNTVEQG